MTYIQHTNKHWALRGYSVILYPGVIGGCGHMGVASQDSFFFQYYFVEDPDEVRNLGNSTILSFKGSNCSHDLQGLLNQEAWHKAELNTFSFPHTLQAKQ